MSKYRVTIAVPEGSLVKEVEAEGFFEYSSKGNGSAVKFYRTTIGPDRENIITTNRLFRAPRVEYTSSRGVPVQDYVGYFCNVLAVEKVG